jgi:hypothetical protein
MHQVQLSDHLYEEAVRRAGHAGFENVDDYIADILRQDFEAPEDYDQLFTQERLSRIDEAAAEIKAGRFYTPGQIDSYIAETKAVWLRENAD